MSPIVSVKPVTAASRSVLDVLAEADKHPTSTSIRLPRDATVEDVNVWLSNGVTRVWLVRCDGEPVGLVHTDLPVDSKIGGLVAVYLVPDARDRAIADQAVRLLQDSLPSTAALHFDT